MKLLKYLGGACLLGLMASCGARTETGKEAQETYGHSLNDSIRAVEADIDSCREQITLLNDQIGAWMRDFTNVANPREAGGYLIKTDWKNRYPLTSTGIVARLNDNGQFELIAALKGGNFDCISVAGPTESASSDIVPNDQALNYRAAGLTTVLFTGPKADEIGRLISDNQLNPLTLDFLQGSRVSSWKIPADNAKMISYTYLLYDAQRNVARAQAKIPMLQEKIKILRIHRNKLETDTESSEK